MEENKCTLNDFELIERCSEWISKLAKTGGRAWTLQVPVNFNSDPDMLFSELIKRFASLGQDKVYLQEKVHVYEDVMINPRKP